MIRIQIYCANCKQYIDANVFARKGRIIAAAFEDAHTLETCLEEEVDGQDQEGSGAAQAVDGPAALAIEGEAAAKERPH